MGRERQETGRAGYPGIYPHPKKSMYDANDALDSYKNATHRLEASILEHPLEDVV